MCDVSPSSHLHNTTADPSYLAAVRLAAESTVMTLNARTADISAERKRNLLALTFSTITITLILFGRQFYNRVRDTTAEVAADVISHERTQIKTSELAAAVVSHVLNDATVSEKVGVFLTKASTNVETTEALMKVVTDVLQSPKVYKECNVLIKNLLKDLVNDPNTTKQVSSLMQVRPPPPWVKNGRARSTKRKARSAHGEAYARSAARRMCAQSERLASGLR